MAARPVGDGESYHIWAQELAGGDWLGSEVFYQAPLYPYFLGVIYKLFGVSLTAAKISQALLGAGSCVLLTGAARRFFDELTGRTAGLLLAFYPVAMFFDGLLQKTTLAFFLFVLILNILSGIHERASLGKWFTIGLVLGLIGITRENALILLPILGLWLLIRFREESWALRIKWGLAFVGGVFLILVPLTLRNKAVGDRLVLTTSNFGVNFYIGNNSEATGRYRPLRPGRDDWKFERIDAVELASSEAGRALAPDEVSKFWLDKALADIAEDPVGWIGLMFRKTALILNRLEISDTEDIYTYGSWSPLLGGLLTVFHFGILALLAALGVALSFERRRELWVWYLIFLGYTASVALFFVFDRFRFPLIAVLIPFAAFGLTRLKWLFSKAGKRHWTATAVVLVLVLGLTNLNLVSKTQLTSNSELNAGKALAKQGKHQEALAHFEPASKAQPNRADIQVSLGNAYLNLGRTAQAEVHLNKARTLKPGDPHVLSQLGLVHLIRGDAAGAADLYRQASKGDPNQPETLNNLAWILATSKDATLRNGEEAVLHAKKACEISNNQKFGYLDTLGAAHAEAGDFDQAVEAARKAIAGARAAGRADKIKAIETRLRNYQANTPFHQ